jgi:hypothetical protein
MTNEQIFEAWADYTCDMIKYSLSSELPHLFKSPHCGTCKFWVLLNQDAMHFVAINSPNEYDKIEKGTKGNILKTYEENGEIVDTYNDYQFYGWCKRMPPTIKVNYSILGIRSLFSKLIRHIPKFIAENSFPAMPHDEWCGEWVKDSWVDDHVEEQTNKGQKRAAQPENQADEK